MGQLPALTARICHLSAKTGVNYLQKRKLVATVWLCPGWNLTSFTFHQLFYFNLPLNMKSSPIDLHKMPHFTLICSEHPCWRLCLFTEDSFHLLAWPRCSLSKLPASSCICVPTASLILLGGVRWRTGMDFASFQLNLSFLSGYKLKNQKWKWKIQNLALRHFWYFPVLRMGGWGALTYYAPMCAADCGLVVSGALPPALFPGWATSSSPADPLLSH